MKQKMIITLAVLLILVAGAIMVWDFYNVGDDNKKNPYEYDLSSFKKVNEELVCYEETGSISPELEKVKAIAIDDKDRIYVAGLGNIVIFDKHGQKVHAFDVVGEVNCLAVSDQGDIYLGINDHIEVYDFSGNNLAVWESPKGRTLITSIALFEEKVFCADAGSKVAYEYDTKGNQLQVIGRRNKEKGIVGFVIPSPYFDLLVGREGELWVVNPGMHTFQSYNDDGELESSWKRTSMQLDGFSGCCNPSHIAMLSNGSFVTSEKGIERVKIHHPSGDFKCVVASPDKFEQGTVGLDLAVDSKDRIYVLDPKKKSVRIFEANS